MTNKLKINTSKLKLEGKIAKSGPPLGINNSLCNGMANSNKEDKKSEKAVIKCTLICMVGVCNYVCYFTKLATTSVQTYCWLIIPPYKTSL